MKMGYGCSTRIMVLLGVVILVLVGFGFIFGTLGSSLFGIEAPGFINVTKPHIALPAEGIAHAGGFTITNTLIASWISVIVLIGFFFAATRKMKIIPGRLQSFAEIVVEGILGFIESASGKEKARIVFPIVATVFLYVITNAYMALIPIFGTIGIWEHGHHGDTFVAMFRGANTDINVPLSIALVSFVAIEFWGLRAFGFFSYLNTFFNVAQLRDGIKDLFKGKIGPALSKIAFGFINLFIGCLEILSHFIRIISFTFRLFGNMTAGEILLLVVVFLVPLIAPIPFYGLELLVGFLQAMIFAGLTLVFGVIALTPHEHAEEHE